MRSMVILCLLFVGLGVVLWYTPPEPQTFVMTQNKKTPTPMPPSPTPTMTPIPIAKMLRNDYHVYETFNNCGPASLSMALSYYGIHKSQAELGTHLRPYQNAQGDNDDKDVTLAELAEEAKKYGLLAYHRPNGSIDLIRKFIAHDMPIITETLLTRDDDIGHFRVIKGYDDTTQTLIQDDSYQGPNLAYRYEYFDFMWKKFNYKYVVLVPPEKKSVAEAILEHDLSEKNAWQQAVLMNQAALGRDPTDRDSRFSLSVALYYTGKYQESVDAFEEVEHQLAPRTLWYQIEPIRAYYELGDDSRVFTLTDAILQNGNRAFSELYLLRGRIFAKQGDTISAKAEYEKALYYNQNMTEAQNMIGSVLP